MDITFGSPHEEKEIVELFLQTFTDSEGPDEGRLIGNLTQDLLQTTEPSDLRCFVARDGAAIAGCILFTRLRFYAGGYAFLLAPVAVRTDRQGQGVGQALIRHGLEVLRGEGEELAVTYGDPAFYGKTGFQPVPVSLIPAPFPLSQPKGWLAQSLSGGEIPSQEGPAFCVDAFRNPVYW